MKDQNDFEYKFAKKVIGNFTCAVYWIVRYDYAEYSFGYQTEQGFVIGPYAFESIDEAEKAIENRESFLRNGDTVMF